LQSHRQEEKAEDVSLYGRLSQGQQRSSCSTTKEETGRTAWLVDCAWSKTEQANLKDQSDLSNPDQLHPGVMNTDMAVILAEKAY